MMVDPNHLALLAALATVVLTTPQMLSSLARAKDFRDKPITRRRLTDAADLTSIVAPIVLIVLTVLTLGVELGLRFILLPIVVLLVAPFLVFALRFRGRAEEDALAVEEAEREKRTTELVDLLIARELDERAASQSSGAQDNRAFSIVLTLPPRATRRQR